MPPHQPGCRPPGERCLAGAARGWHWSFLVVRCHYPTGHLPAAIAVSPRLSPHPAPCPGLHLSPSLPPGLPPYAVPHLPSAGMYTSSFSFSRLLQHVAAHSMTKSKLDVFSHSSGGQKSKSKVSSGLHSLQKLSLPAPRPRCASVVVAGLRSLPCFGTGLRGLHGTNFIGDSKIFQYSWT